MDPRAGGFPSSVPRVIVPGGPGMGDGRDVGGIDRAARILRDPALDPSTFGRGLGKIQRGFESWLQLRAPSNLNLELGRVDLRDFLPPPDVREAGFTTTLNQGFISQYHANDGRLAIAPSQSITVGVQAPEDFGALVSYASLANCETAVAAQGILIRAYMARNGVVSTYLGVANSLTQRVWSQDRETCLWLPPGHSLEWLIFTYAALGATYEARIGAIVYPVPEGLWPGCK